MIKFTKASFVLPFILSFLLIVLIILLSTQRNFSGSLNKLNFTNPFEKADYADIFIEDSSLKVKFSIENENKVQEFLNNLSLTDSVLDGLSLELDSYSLDRLSQILPAKVKITIDGKNLSFKSPNQVILKNPSSKYSYKLATKSGSLVFNNSDLQNFNLEVENPEILVKFATESGKLILSEKLDDLFPILSKISKMELKVYNKAISGEIVLK